MIHLQCTQSRPGLSNSSCIASPFCVSVIKLGRSLHRKNSFDLGVWNHKTYYTPRILLFVIYEMIIGLIRAWINPAFMFQCVIEPESEKIAQKQK